MSKPVWVKGHYRGQRRSKNSEPQAQRGGCLGSVFKLLFWIVCIVAIIDFFYGKDDVNPAPTGGSAQQLEERTATE